MRPRLWRRASAAVIVTGAATVLTLAGVASATAPQEVAGAAVPDYARDVVPILESNCLRCHNPAKHEGGLLLDAYEDLMRGGDIGPAIDPGNAERSLLVRLVEGREKPKMPPRGQLQADEIATLRAWIDHGARFSALAAPSLDDRLPRITQQAPLLPQVFSLAFARDGREIAVAGYREVRRAPLSPHAGAQPPAPPSSHASATTGAERTAYTGLRDLVRTVAYSPDGSMLAAGGGTAGAFGEVVLFDAASGEPRHTLHGHRDYVHHLAFSPDGSRLATCGYDRTVRVWDVASGRPLAVLREHTEAVYAVAFAPDGRWLASAAGDRSVKIWDVERGTRLHTVSDATAVLLTADFHPVTGAVSAAGHDRTIRTWTFDPAGARQVRAVIAHTAPVLAIRYSPDGSRVASAAADGSVKIWDGASGREVLALEPQGDWAQGLAWSHDGRLLAVGRYDGTASVYDAATGSRVADIPTTPPLHARTP